MDAFYAAVEQLDDPSLRGRPVIIGHRSRRSVVSTASYEARPFGVRSAMPMYEALRRCPDAIVVEPRFERYQAVSRAIMAVFREFSPDVEALSLDEAFLDLTGSEALFGPPRAIGEKLKARVRAATGGLNCSVGLSNTKFVAKVLSDHEKPDGLTVVLDDAVPGFLASLPVARLWGAGPKTVARLEARGFRRMGDLAAASEHALEAALGPQGVHFGRLARGVDARAVSSGGEAKSIGSERTLERDVRDRRAIEGLLRRSADEVARRLRKADLVAEGVRIKLKTADFRTQSRQRSLSPGTDCAQTLWTSACGLLSDWPWGPAYRLVGLTAFSLAPADRQLALLDDHAQDRKVEAVIDAVEARFGRSVLRRADGGPASLGEASGSGPSS